LVPSSSDFHHALTGGGMIRARRVAFGVTDSAFIMGSMGSVVGERLRG
jgi:acetyl-CoA carboxylase carboxyl transferase subunit beta